MLYKVLIRPRMECCENPSFKKDIEAIDKKQKRVTKLVNCLRQLPYEVRLKILNIPFLRYTRFRGDIIQTWKLLNGKNTLTILYSYRQLITIIMLSVAILRN